MLRTEPYGVTIKTSQTGVYWRFSNLKLLFRPEEMANTTCKTLHCFHVKSGVTFFSLANDSETNKNVCQVMLASFGNAHTV